MNSYRLARLGHPIGRPVACSERGSVPDPRNYKASSKEARTSRILQESKKFLSPHPAAVRRRREAELRSEHRRRHLQDLKEQTTALTTNTRNEEHIRNLVSIDCLSEFHFRIASGSRTHEQVLVHFKSKTCQSCSRLQYTLKCIARNHPETLFLVIDIGDGSGELGELCSQLGITSIPYFQLYRVGELYEEGLWNEVHILKSHELQDFRVCSTNNSRTYGVKQKLCDTKSIERSPQGGNGDGIDTSSTEALNVLLNCIEVEWDTVQNKS